MYTLWLQQYLAATQIGAELFSNVYAEWSKGVVQLTQVGLGLPFSDKHFDEAWLDRVSPHAPANRAPSRVGNCAARLYSRQGFNLARGASNEASWIICLQEA